MAFLIAFIRVVKLYQYYVHGKYWKNKKGRLFQIINNHFRFKICLISTLNCISLILVAKVKIFRPAIPVDQPCHLSTERKWVTIEMKLTKSCTLKKGLRTMIFEWNDIMRKTSDKYCSQFSIYEYLIYVIIQNINRTINLVIS